MIIPVPVSIATSILGVLQYSEHFCVGISFSSDYLMKYFSYSTGWGQTSGVNPFPPNHLQWARLPIQTSENCQNVYTGTITEGEICAGDNKATVCNVSI